MHRTRSLAILALAAATVLGMASGARAISPQNPYRSFNLSGLNYGSMQWEKAHRGTGGRSTSATASRSYAGGGFIQGGGARPGRLFRRR